jgi:glutaminyl-tRNA synthetase
MTTKTAPDAANLDAGLSKHFLRSIVEQDLADGVHHTVVTRFPPEPNGFLHVGHAKSICLNFGLAKDYQGVCHLRMDDTNPEKESDEYVNSIIESVRWMGFEWHGKVRYASDYFEDLYQYAVELILSGKAYVCELPLETMRAYRGSLTEKGQESPYRNRSVAENIDQFQRMRAGEFADGSKVLRLKIDMASGNMNMRDPVIYRIRRAHHHRTGDAWCIYPLYDFTHCISDAIEGITHSICTLEFEDHRPLYDWVLANISIEPKPRQYEFSRLELMYALTSKRKLNQLVEDKHVSGWDDPRMPTIAGMRRRGYSPAGLQLFAARIGVSRSENIVDFSVLEGAIRDTLEHESPRVLAVLHPLKVTIRNYTEALGSRSAPFHPKHEAMGERLVPFGSTLWIEHDDFAEVAPEGWQRLSLGGEVRLRYSYIMRCDEVIKDATGQVIELICSVDTDTLGKNPVGRKVKGVIHWLAQASAVASEVRWYDRLFTVARPDAMRDDTDEYIDFMTYFNHDSYRITQGFVEPCVLSAEPETRYHFERLGYFVTDRHDHQMGQRIVLNRTVGLVDKFSDKK